MARRVPCKCSTRAPERSRPLVTPLTERLVVDFAWLPDGVSLLFTEGGVPGSAITGIDLWRVDANGENRALVASAGTVAPVARIANSVHRRMAEAWRTQCLFQGQQDRWSTVSGCEVFPLAWAFGSRCRRLRQSKISGGQMRDSSSRSSPEARHRGGRHAGAPSGQAGRINGRAMGRTRGCRDAYQSNPDCGTSLDLDVGR